MIPPLPAPARLTAAILLAAACVAGAASAAAQDWTSPRARDAAARAWERPRTDPPAGPREKAGAQKRTYTHAESTRIGAEVRRQAEARERGWDRKMKAVSGSICAGC
jgi:hypothetical protein